MIAQYKTMREALVYLTHLNYDDTEAIMLEKLSAQVGGVWWLVAGGWWLVAGGWSRLL